MPDKVFIDTNVLIYVYSQDEPGKQQQAISCIQQGEAWISTQVLNETTNVLKRKFSLQYPEIRIVLEEFISRFQVALVSTTTIWSALTVAERYHYSYFDSLMIASALEVSCDYLYSEDLQHGQVIDGQLTILSPFESQL